MEIEVGQILQHIQDKDVIVMVHNIRPHSYSIKPLSEKAKEWVYNCHPDVNCKDDPYRRNNPQSRFLILPQKKHRFERTWKVSITGQILYGR